jgi:hypothetical protein
MPRPRLNLSDLLVLIVVCGVAFASYRYFWQGTPQPNARPWLSAFLACLAIASLGSFFGHPRFRRSFQGFTVFGFYELIFVAWGGFWWATARDGLRIAEASKMGIVFGLLCALIAGWLFQPVRQSDKTDRRASDSP